LLPTDEGFTSLGLPPPCPITFPVPPILGTGAEVAHRYCLAPGTMDVSPKVAHEFPLAPGTSDAGPKVAHESIPAPDILDADPQEVDLNHGPQCNNSCAVCCKGYGQTSVCEDTVTKIVDDICRRTPKGKSNINSKWENSSLSMILIGLPLFVLILITSSPFTLHFFRSWP
jgi:hypothetical protein